MTTEAELYNLDSIVKALEKKGIAFNNMNTVLDWNNEYSIDSRPFLGNLSKSTGRFYGKTDTFNIYIPKYHTNLSYVDEKGQIVRTGLFEDTLLNGYQLNSSSDLNTYWVTEYGSFTQPTYSFINNDLPNGSSILLVMDSMGFRTASYLSLMCSKVTIVDPRYGNDGTTLSSVLASNKFDAVVLLQNVSLKDYNLLFNPTSLQSQIVSQNIPSHLVAGKSVTFSVTVKNTGTQTWSEKDQIRLGVFLNDADSGVRAYLPADVTVAPGETYTFTFSDFNPPAAGTKIEFWMLQEGVTYFGDRVPANTEVLRS